MNKITFGIFFLLFNFYFIIGPININLLPDSVGCILILIGSKELIKDSSKIKTITIITIIAMLSSLIVEVSIFLLLELPPMIHILNNIIITFYFLVTTYIIINELIKKEEEKNRDYKAKRLLKLWKIMTLTILLTYTAYLNVEFELTLVSINLMVSIMFTIMFYISKNIYKSYR